MKKVFASDFDGTLYFYLAEDDRKLPAENVAKIRKYQAAGNLFGLCIVDTQFKEIRKRGVDPRVADAIIKKYGVDNFRFTLDVEGDICVFNEMDYPGKYYIITGVEDAPQGLIHQVSIHTECLEDAARMAAEINAEFGDAVNAFQNVIEIDIAPKGCSKGEGVRFLREYMKKEYGDIRLYGIGDSMNDLPLIEASDVSYTFPYAPKELQDRVTMVVPTIVEALDHSMKEVI